MGGLTSWVVEGSRWLSSSTALESCTVEREGSHRVVNNNPVSGDRIFVMLRTEEEARAKARELEQFIAHAAPIRDKEEGRRTVQRLADRCVSEHLATLSTRFMEKQAYLLRRWILPRIGERTVTDDDAGRRVSMCP